MTPANVNETSLPVPDPSERSSAEVRAGDAAERDYVDGRIAAVSERLAGKVAVIEQRLDAIDKATRLLNETVNRVPTETQLVISALREVIDEKFNSVGLQFKERDTRQERESRDNKLAVDAAFAAQEKQAVAQNDSNTLAINKSEQATAETIDKLAELVKSNLDALKDKQDDLTRRFDKLV